MAKTKHPHPAIYLTFACYVTETDEMVDGLLSPCAPPETWDGLRGDIPAPYLRHHAWEHRSLRDLVEERERACLEQLGITAEALESPLGLTYREAHVLNRLEFQSRQARMIPSADLKFDEYGRYEPRRGTMLKIVAGEYFAFGQGNTGQTAKSLNTGLPRKDEASESVTHFNVRDALAGFVRCQPPHASWFATVAAEVRRARILNRLWDLHAVPHGRLSLPKLQRMIEHGELFDAYTALLAEASPPEALPPSLQWEAISTAIGRTAAADCRRRVDEYLSRGGNPDALQGPFQALVSH